MKCRNKDCETLKTILTVIGVITAIATMAVTVYVLFKKYFKITFEDDGEIDECDCDGCFIEQDDTAYEPVCNCECGCDCETAE